MAVDTGGWGLTPIGAPSTSTAALPQPTLTPDQIKAMREEAMNLQKPPTQPIQHWTQGLAELVRAIQGNREADFARQAEAQGRQQGADAISQIYAPYLSPGGSSTSGAGAASAGAPGGASADASPSTGTNSTSAAATPRGIRNNNPLNIEDGPFAKSQQGYTGSDGRFATFQTPEHGTAAADNLLSTYSTKYGLNTVSGIVNRWAPQADGNNTDAYAAAVAAKLGIGPNDPIPPGMRNQLIAAMAEHENGVPFKMPGMAATAPAAGQPTGLLAPFQSATAAPPPSAAAAPSPAATPPPATAATPPTRLAYAGAGPLPAGMVPPATPATPPASPLSPIVNAIAGRPTPPPVDPTLFSAQAKVLAAKQQPPAAPNVTPQAEPIPPADFASAANAVAAGNGPLGIPPPPSVPLPQPRPAGAPVSPTVPALVNAISGGQPGAAPAAGAPNQPPSVRVAQNGPLTTAAPAALAQPPAGVPAGLPQPLTSASSQISQEQLTRVLANPWVPDSAKSAMLQMIQQRGQPQSMPVEGGTLMYNSAGQRVFIPEPKFGTVKVGGAEIPTVSHFDPATRRWNTTTLAPGGGVQTVGGAATGQPPAPSAAGEPDLSTIGGIQRAEVNQAGAKKAAEEAGSARSKMFNTIYSGMTGNATNASRQEGIIEAMQRIAPAAMTGTGADLSLGLNRLASQLGINPQGAAPRELFNQLSAKLLADQFANIRSMASEEGSPGARIFKSMLEMEEKANITPEDSLEGVQAKLSFMKKFGDNLKRWGDMADDYAASHNGQLDESFMKTIRHDMAAQKFDEILPRADSKEPTGMRPETAAGPSHSDIEAEMRKRGLLPGGPAAPAAAPVSQ